MTEVRAVSEHQGRKSEQFRRKVNGFPIDIPSAGGVILRMNPCGEGFLLLKSK
jgi:hypothetical protein